MYAVLVSCMWYMNRAVYSNAIFSSFSCTVYMAHVQDTCPCMRYMILYSIHPAFFAGQKRGNSLFEMLRRDNNSIEPEVLPKRNYAALNLFMEDKEYELYLQSKGKRPPLWKYCCDHHITKWALGTNTEDMYGNDTTPPTPQGATNHVIDEVSLSFE